MSKRIAALRDRILSLRGKAYDTKCKIPYDDIKNLCTKSIDYFRKIPTVVRLKSPLIVVGDIHGQFFDLIRIFDEMGYPPKQKFLFLGDYVDRGNHSVEVITLLLCYKLLYPHKVFLLRGNHECLRVSMMYGFFNECLKYYNAEVWRDFITVFDYLPIAGTINRKIFCVHGGISPLLKKIKQIDNITRPCDIPEEGLLCDLMWSDPSSQSERWEPNDRGISMYYGKKAVDYFLKRNGYKMMIRAHQSLMSGFSFPFYPQKKTLTVFSAPNYCNAFGNRGGIVNIDRDLMCSLVVFDPVFYDEDDNEEPGTVPLE